MNQHVENTPPDGARPGLPKGEIYVKGERVEGVEAPPLPAGPQGLFHAIKELGDLFNATGKVSAFSVSGKLLADNLRYQAATGTWWTLESSQDNILRNKQVALPLLDAAFSGDLEARKMYERERVFHMRYLPAWGEEIVEDTLKARLASYRPGTRLHPSAMSHRKDIERWRYPYMENSIPAVLGVTCMASYSAVQEFLAESADYKYPQFEGWKGVWIKGKCFPQCTDMYTPVAPGPVGKHARETLVMVSNLMLKALVLDDYLSSLQVEVPETTKIQLLRAVSHAWELADLPAIKNIPALKAELDNRQPALPAEEKERLLSRFIFRPDALSQLRAHLEGPAPKVEPADPPRLEPLPQLHDIYRANFINGVMAAVLREHPTLEEPREVARRFFSLHRRGACSYMQVVHEIGKGGDPYELLGAIYTRELKRERGQQPKVKREPFGGVEHKEEQLRRLVVVQHTRLFDKWLDSLSDHFQAAVRGRLLRMELNHFGDWGPIGTNIRELRLDTGPGFRIYFARISDCEMLLLCGGDKNSQSKDIARAHRIAHAVGLE